ncbi:flavin reductase family protein [Peribacillus glennii]|uniref:flavin reductase family protein n=1 Tax=Peribacillus glennii TaxID=2303991 RepID=UPI001314F68B|nr:flavin reductase family protein [Peribacillus glennii]
MDQRKFRDISGSFATGVTVVTTKNEKGHPVGMTANSFTSLSLDPPLVIINVDKKSSLYTEFLNAESFAVNILSSEQEDISRRFSTKNIDRFEGISYEEDVTGSPILKDVIGYFDCDIVKHYDGGDHTILIGETKGGNIGSGEPLIFYRGKYQHVNNPVVK